MLNITKSISSLSQVDVKSEGSNVIVVKMTFPENENIQGLRAYSPTQPAELEKFDVVHNALDPNARIEQVSAVNLDELPELRRDERGLENQLNLNLPLGGNFIPSSNDVIDLSKDILGNQMQYTEPPTRPPRPTKPAPPSSLPPTSTTPVPIDQAVFPLEYFTESDVKKEKRNILPGNPPPKATRPIQYSGPSIQPPPRPKASTANIYAPAPPPIHASQKISYASPKILTPPPRPQPFRPPTYSNNLTPESGYSFSGPNPGYYY